MINRMRQFMMLFVFISFTLAVSGCSFGSDTAEVEETKTNDTHDGDHADEHVHDDEHTHNTTAEKLTLPELGTIELNDEPLRVVVTTSIIGDVVAQVGGCRACRYR